MPVTDIAILTVIVVVFTIFGLVLAWGDYQTRDLPRQRDAGKRNEGRVVAMPPQTGQVTQDTTVRAVANRKW